LLRKYKNKKQEKKTPSSQIPLPASFDNAMPYDQLRHKSDKSADVFAVPWSPRVVVAARIWDA
jgi:hypothetical protein